MKVATNEARVILRTPYLKQREFISSKAKRRILRAGRRSGKTTGIAIDCVMKFLAGRRVLYAAPVLDQTDKFWTEVTRALAGPVSAGWYRKNETSRFIEVEGTENRIRAKTAWDADTMRGDWADDIVLDEYALMDEGVWMKVVAPMLLDRDGTCTFIYTPPDASACVKSRAKDPMHAATLYRKAQADTTGRWAAFHFTSHDNPHLSKVALSEITQDMDDRSYRQEILAEDIWETPGALWDQGMIDAHRITIAPEWLESVVVGVDPSKSGKAGSDECGIVVCGVDGEGVGYVLEDRSLRGPPEQWGAEVVDAVKSWEERAGECYVLAESNAGGEMIATVLRQIEPSLRVELVPAVVNKYVRAQPVRSRWGREECRIVGSWPRLEHQLTNWLDGAAWSPDRMDAMVHALRRLLLHRREISVGSIDL